jgi:hypothetical protein
MRCGNALILLLVGATCTEGLLEADRRCGLLSELNSEDDWVRERCRVGAGKPASGPADVGGQYGPEEARPQPDGSVLVVRLRSERSVLEPTVRVVSPVTTPAFFHLPNLKDKFLLDFEYVLPCEKATSRWTCSFILETLPIQNVTSSRPQ